MKLSVTGHVQGTHFQAYLALGVALGREDAHAVAQQWREAADTHRSQQPQ